MEQVKKILWIDDDIQRGILQPYVDEFFDEGYQVIGITCVDKLNETIDAHMPISAIIVDIQMPPGSKIDFYEAKGGLLTGRYVLEQLLSDERFKNIPKIAFTIIDDDDFAKFASERNIVYLKKNDYFTNTLVQKIKEILM